VIKGKGKVILLIGKKDAGKTTKVKELLRKSKKHELIYDFRSEYGYKLLDIDDFLELALLEENCNIVIEECTVYLDHKSDNRKVKNLLSGASHKNNNIYLLYHTMRSIPGYIFDLIDYYYLFHTSDNEGVVRKLFRYEPDIIEDFLLVKGKTNPHFYTVRKR